MAAPRRSLEGLAVTAVLPDPEFWRGRKVFLTGHTGFKGGWLALWLGHMGAEVTGYALAPETDPSLYALAGVAGGMRSVIADIRDADAVARALRDSGAAIVFHLAAQALVRASYADPLGTYASNVMGTAHVLEAVRQTPSVQAVQVITSDKCYDNREWDYPYRETDRLGGHDPYSNSKACAELVVESYRRSFLRAAGIRLASSRAGNVIGGGDWAPDRIVPDCIRALAAGRPITIRSPQATRPWQHVLEPLSGYLVLAERQYQDCPEAEGGFNFGPRDEAAVPVGELAAGIVRAWGGGELQCAAAKATLHEAGNLRLDISKARARLGWQPRWDLEQALAMTVDWYRRVLCRGEDAGRVCLEQIAAYTGQEGRFRPGETAA